MRDCVSHHLEGLESVLTQELTREHRQNTDQTSLDQERIAGKRDYSLLFCPIRDDLYERRLDIVCQVGFALLCDEANLEFAQRARGLVRRPSGCTDLRWPATPARSVGSLSVQMRAKAPSR